MPTNTIFLNSNKVFRNKILCFEDSLDSQGSSSPDWTSLGSVSLVDIRYICYMYIENNCVVVR